jgi:hypothetical protein
MALTRAEFFHILNHVQFQRPSGEITSSVFRVGTSATDPRIAQLTLKWFL